MKARDLVPGNSVSGYRVQSAEMDDDTGKVLVDVGLMVWVYDWADEADDLAYVVVQFHGGIPHSIPHVWTTWPKHKLRPTSCQAYAMAAAAELNAMQGFSGEAEVIAMPWAMAARDPWY